MLIYKLFQTGCFVFILHKSFLRLGVGGGGLGPLFKRLLRSTDACTSLMAARKEPRLPASSVVQLGGCRHHQGRGDPQCPGWTSGEEAVRDKPLVTDSVRPPQEPRQHAQGQSPEETHRSGYQWARVTNGLAYPSGRSPGSGRRRPC